MKGSSQNGIIAQYGVGGKTGHSCVLGDRVGRGGQERLRNRGAMDVEVSTKKARMAPEF